MSGEQKSMILNVLKDIWGGDGTLPKITNQGGRDFLKKFGFGQGGGD